MRVYEACRETSENCPFYSGVCRDRFGRFKCGSCVRNQNTEVLTYASDGSPIWSTYRVLILTHALGPDGRDIRQYVEAQHRGAHLDYLNYQNLLWGILKSEVVDHIIDNFKSGRYVSVYIDTQDRKERQKLRKFLKDKYGLDVHIKTYAKLVEKAKRNSFRK